MLQEMTDSKPAANRRLREQLIQRTGLGVVYCKNWLEDINDILDLSYVHLLSKTFIAIIVAST